MPLGPVQCHRCPKVVMGNAAFREHMFTAHVAHEPSCHNHGKGFLYPCSCPLPEQRPETVVCRACGKPSSADCSLCYVMGRSSPSEARGKA